VTEAWTPNPTPTPKQLTPYLAEISSRELCRVTNIEVAVLRFEEIVTAENFGNGSNRRAHLHLEDALDMIRKAIELPAVTLTFRTF
jgi:hypothetical protein